ncbi:MULTISPECIES: flavodoxin domain-containing protein [unclassified Methanoregula]|uniref:flavodoxin domain-containing protein n=1 Tax=unclassified Methanoregula TaxID=2649730 RepID=UPI0009CE9074|nr:MULTISPECIES: flavodoxin domain-containing protein [unclassified Methanoregula]OPX64287.1 MAG: protoporphyrinogen oxidase [Methanoregula sp. PtaB.Bin085]OPY33588.1 MAG: protoporphyrinogen oxidase [Methanoregula sp. PtaU1.Bin006]
MAARILVAYTTRKGSTAEVALAIGKDLEKTGAVVTVADMTTISSLEGYTGVVIGTPVYTGKVSGDVTAFATRFKDQLQQVPVAGFVTGIAPVYPKTGDVSVFTGQLAGALAPVQLVAVAMFAGKLDAARLSLIERGMTSLLKVPTGDFRDWAAIAAWTRELPAKMGI